MTSSAATLAVDPGKMTGWAVWWRESRVFQSGEMAHVEFLDWADANIGLFGLVVVENFIVTIETAKKSRGDMWSLKQIGCLEHWCHSRGIEFDIRSASDAKGFSGNDRLKALGWYVPGKGHANDAARHLLLAMAIRHRYNGHEVDSVVQ